MTNEFKPDNPLEEKLLALYKKEIKISYFLELLLETQVIILADRDVDITIPDAHFNPLAITSPMGYNVLATFSSLIRAQQAASLYPRYSHAIAVDTSWFLLRAYENVGFALNPGWAFGFELPPEALQQMLIRFGVKRGGGLNG
jgi:hypothetical protein